MTEPARPRGAFSSAVDLATEEGRAFLQERLALFSKIGFFLTLGFYCVAYLSFLFAFPLADFLHGFSAPLSALNLLPTLSCLIVWLVCRRGRVPRVALDLLDVGLVFVMGMLPALRLLSGSRSPAHVYTMLLILTNVLVARALFVPSTPWRTLGVCLAATALPLAASYRYQKGQAVPPMGGGLPYFLVETLLWGVATVATAPRWPRS